MGQYFYLWLNTTNYATIFLALLFYFLLHKNVANVQHQGQIQDLNLGGDMYQVAGV